MVLVSFATAMKQLTVVFVGSNLLAICLVYKLLLHMYVQTIPTLSKCITVNDLD